MRRALLALLSALALSACVSTIQGAYDDRREEECRQENYGRDRINC